jgi:hypothetical protein
VGKQERWGFDRMNVMNRILIPIQKEYSFPILRIVFILSEPFPFNDSPARAEADALSVANSGNEVAPGLAPLIIDRSC